MESVTRRTDWSARVAPAGGVVLDAGQVHIISAAVVVMSVAFFGYCVHRSILAKRSAAWPKTKGRVVASHMEVTQDRHDTTEAPVFAYEYEVEGVTYVSADVYAGWSSFWSSLISTVAPSWSGARRFIANLPLDASVDVYYSPGNPALSCLYPGRHRGPRVGMAIAVVVATLALLYPKLA